MVGWTKQIRATARICVSTATGAPCNMAHTRSSHTKFCDFKVTTIKLNQYHTFHYPENPSKITLTKIFEVVKF
jgi:hypothetical protein